MSETILRENGNGLETQIKLLHKHLKTRERYDGAFLPPPLFIEFAGTPSSGKTTIIKELYKFLKRSGFKVAIPQEGAEVVPHTHRNSPKYNIRTGMYALEILLRLQQTHEYDFVLFDRCIFDAYVWMTYWNEKGMLSAEETKLLQQYFLFPQWSHDIGVAYYVVCDPKIAIERENAIAISQKLGETTNPKTLEKLIAFHFQAYSELKDSFHQLHLLDTTALNRLQMVETVTKDLFNTLLLKVE
ncbi:MAG: AAA family ATPase [Parcubacteria group bacterium]|nr:AAA family ATPase [Parcubacteria group bacterium]